MDFPSPSVMKEALQSHIKTPVVFKNMLKSWTHIPWTTEQLGALYGEISLIFRLFPKADKTISWEGGAKYVNATINQFIDWSLSRCPVEKDNPFYEYNVKDFWAYSSYNYVNNIFHEDSDIVKALNWSAFGYPENCGKDSAFWIGNEGAYTPCHYDTYGFNLVAQIQGRKKWTLFPPEDTPNMYPTRIPYEESSVFSSVNILHPDFNKHPLFKLTHPHVVILEPGDVLFIPKQWWHFVQSLDVTVSINTWIKLDSDDTTHLEEGITRALMSSFITYFEPVGESWVNPNEELVSPEETLKYISQGLNKIKSLKEDQNNSEELNSQPGIKFTKKDFESDVHSTAVENQIKKILNHKDIRCVTSEPFLKWYGKTISIPTGEKPLQDLSAKNIIDCFVHPEVITVICKLLKNL